MDFSHRILDLIDLTGVSAREISRLATGSNAVCLGPWFSLQEVFNVRLRFRNLHGHLQFDSPDSPNRGSLVFLAQLSGTQGDEGLHRGNKVRITPPGSRYWGSSEPPGLRSRNRSRNATPSARARPSTRSTDRFSAGQRKSEGVENGAIQRRFARRHSFRSFDGFENRSPESTGSFGVSS